MIEPTDEMVQAFRRAFNDKAAELAATAPDFIEGGVVTRTGLAAVLAIVERDYAVTHTGQCGAPGPDGLTCERPVGHDAAGHTNRSAPNGWVVEW